MPIPFIDPGLVLTDLIYLIECVIRNEHRGFH